MIAFFESTHIDMWDGVEKDNHIPLDTQKNEIPKDKWMDDHKSRFIFNSRARSVILLALSQEEYSKVHSFICSKQMQETLAITYEGSSELKPNMWSLLTRKYELISMREKISKPCLVASKPFSMSFALQVDTMIIMITLIKSYEVFLESGDRGLQH